jgi:GNAT superfamily N-acetyltransferase
VLVRRRADLDEAQASAVLAGIAEVEWDALYHAYGPASDVPVLLGAVTVGDDATRQAAWWELWGNIHHQGSVYEATRPAVDLLIALATWKTYPDRVEALRVLREVARSEDVRVWHYGDDGKIVHDERRSREVGRALLEAVQQRADELLGSWREEPEAVRRAQLWLLTALPAQLHRYRDLVDAVLPADYDELWPVLVAGEELDEEQLDQLNELEEWLEASGEDR